MVLAPLSQAAANARFVRVPSRYAELKATSKPADSGRARSHASNNAPLASSHQLIQVNPHKKKSHIQTPKLAHCLASQKTLALEVKNLEVNNIDNLARILRLESSLSHAEAKYEDSEITKSQIHGQLQAELEEARASLQLLRDTMMPTLARQLEEERTRADTSERNAAMLREKLGEREATLKEQASHFAKLEGALGRVGDGGLSNLTQQALASFGKVSTHFNVHTDSRFSELQDNLVRLCMTSESLLEWLPWFVASKKIESSLHVDEEPREEDTVLRASDCGALSPELLVPKCRRVVDEVE